MMLKFSRQVFLNIRYFFVRAKELDGVEGGLQWKLVFSVDFFSEWNFVTC